MGKMKCRWGTPLVAVVVLSLLSGCGGGGSSSDDGAVTPTATLSGVAAAGLPVVGYVWLKDSGTTTLGPTPISSDGSFTFNVTGLTAPFYLRAKGTVAGTSYDLYSATTSSGTANVNPLTNLAVAAAAGVSDPGTVFENPSQAPITQANLDRAVSDIQSLMAPLLEAYNAASVNPITGAYAADRTGLDAMLDVVAVNIDASTGSVAIVNTVTNTTISSGSTTTLATTTDAILPTDVTAVQSATTDTEAIQAMMSQFVAVINKGAALLPADLEPFYATNYGIDDGFDRTQTLNDDWGDFQGWTTTVTSLNVTITAVGADYKIDGAATLSDGSFGFWEEGVIVTSEGGSWKFKGNGYKSSVEFFPYTIRWINADGSLRTESGFICYIDDDGNYGLESAKITGSGLPTGGLTFSQPANEPVRVWLDTQFQDSTMPTDMLNFYPVSDADLASIPDNATYTIQVFDASNNVVETRTRTFPKRPYMRSELTDGHFPTLGGIASHGMMDANVGSTRAFTYAKPTAYLTAEMWAVLNFWSGSGSAWYDVDLLLNQSSGSIISGSPTSWTPTDALFKLEAEDEYGREVSLTWMFE